MKAILATPTLLHKCLLWFIGIIIFTCSYSPTTLAGNDKFALGAKQAAMGNTATFSQSAFATFNNPAGLGYLEQLNAGLYYENRFMVTDLNFAGLAVALPTTSGTFGIGASHFGNTDYSQSHLRLSYGKLLSSNFSIGLGLETQLFSIAEADGTVIFTFALGSRYQISKMAAVAVNIQNPLSQSPTNDDVDNLPSIFQLGFAFTPTEKATFIVEGEKTTENDPTFKAGIEYNIAKPIYLRAGVGTEPTISTFGIGFKFNQLSIDLAAGYHLDLGFSPQFSLKYGL